jgi:hypothetical protein
MSQSSTLSVPCRPGMPAYRLKSKTGSMMYYHMSYSSRSRLPAQEGSDAAMCPAAPDPAPYSGGLWRCHVSDGSGPCLLAREGSDAVTYPVHPDPASLLGGALAQTCVRGSGPCLPVQEGFGAATCPTALSRPHALGRKKRLAGLGIQLGLRVSNAHSSITKTLARRAGRRHHYDLQTMQTSTTVPRRPS